MAGGVETQERPVDARSWGKEALNPIKSQLMQEEIELERVSEVDPLPLPSAEQVRHWSRFLSLEDAAVGVLFSRCGGAQPKHLRSFPDSVEFLKPISPYVAYQVHGEVNLIGVAYYADWIRDVVGDADLAEALRPYAEKETVTGRQLANIRPIIRARLNQYKEVVPDLDTCTCPPLY